MFIAYSSIRVRVICTRPVHLDEEEEEGAAAAEVVEADAKLGSIAPGASRRLRVPPPPASWKDGCVCCLACLWGEVGHKEHSMRDGGRTARFRAGLEALFSATTIGNKVRLEGQDGIHTLQCSARASMGPVAGV